MKKIVSVYYIDKAKLKEGSIVKTEYKKVRNMLINQGVDETGSELNWILGGLFYGELYNRQRGKITERGLWKIIRGLNYAVNNNGYRITIKFNKYKIKIKTVKRSEEND